MSRPDFRIPALHPRLSVERTGVSSRIAKLIPVRISEPLLSFCAHSPPTKTVPRDTLHFARVSACLPKPPIGVGHQFDFPSRPATDSRDTEGTPRSHWRRACGDSFLIFDSCPSNLWPTICSSRARGGGVQTSGLAIDEELEDADGDRGGRRGGHGEGARGRLHGAGHREGAVNGCGTRGLPPRV